MTHYDQDRRQAAIKAMDTSKGPTPYHRATSQKASAASPQGPEQPRRLGLADLRAAAMARKAASQSSCG